MAERARRVETIRAGRPVRVGDVTLLPIERVVVCSDRSRHGGWVTGAVEPVAVVVRDAGGVRVVERDGTAGSLDCLRERIPGLDALVVAPRP